MSGIDRYMDALWDKRHGRGGNAAAASAQLLLGGDLDGNRLITVGPEGGELHITFNGPESFFVYDTSGSRKAAVAYVREKLGLVPEVEDPADRIAKAMTIWRDTIPAAASIIERYLRRRAITLPAPSDVRFHPELQHSRSYGRWPAMVSAVTDASGEMTGIHCTFLQHDGRGKVQFDPARKMLGVITGGTVRLAPVADEIAIGEGIETSLAFMELTGTPAWAAMSAINLRALRLPPEIRSVILLADNKDDSDPGPSACRRAHQRLASIGLRVRIEYAPPGADFNDVLIKEKAR